MGEVDDDEEELLPSRVECLVFVVHGIGQYHHALGRGSEKHSGFHKDVEGIRKFSVAHLRGRMEAGQKVPGRIEFLPLEWFESIHLEHGIGRRLANATLPSVKALRDFANFAIADILVYQDEEWREQIQKEISGKMTTLWRKFSSRTPEYSGEISIMAHSLGSVIMFDVVQRAIPQLNEGLLLEPSSGSQINAPDVPTVFPRRLTNPAFEWAASAERKSQTVDTQGKLQNIADGGHETFSDSKDTTPPSQMVVGVGMSCGSRAPMPRCFFAIGSPLGMFLSIRLSRKRLVAQKLFQGLDVRWPASSMSAGWRFFNIFHPDDPIAYRVEPLLNCSYAEVPPRVVPHLGGLRWNNQVRDWWGKIRNTVTSPAAEEEEDDAVKDVLLINLEASDAVSKFFDESPGKPRDKAAVDRIDYALQETAFDSMNEFLSAMNSHFAYWGCEDMVHFVVDQIMEALDSKAQERPAPPAGMPSPPPGVAW